MNGPVDFVISFDTTGSMYPCLTQVRNVVRTLVNDLFQKVPNIRIGIIAHGDYCDGPLCITKMDLSPSRSEISSFIETAPRTSGGDCPECYELVIHETRAMSWRAEAKKVFLLIGDDVPHERNPKNLSWKNELKMLHELDVTVYSVHALSECRRHSKFFYEEIARMSDGFYLTLDQFSIVNELITAVCLKQVSDELVEEYERILGSEKRITRNHGTMFNTLLRRTKTTVPVKHAEASLAGRFQVLEIDRSMQIRDFVESQGIEFKKGRGFYQLSKAETIQGQKEVMLVDKETFDIFDDKASRKILGLPKRSEQFSKDRKDVRMQFQKNAGSDIFQKYFVFVQSTSVNRKLVPGTKLLYEIPDWEHSG